MRSHPAVQDDCAVQPVHAVLGVQAHLAPRAAQPLAAGAIVLCLAVTAVSALRAAPPAGTAPPAAKVSPVDLVKTAPKGSLKNPYTDAMPDIVARGETLFQTSSCSACHGPQGGGGLCPPVTNDIWVYGGDDDTLFRLIALGSDQLQRQGYSRTGHESIVASMPAFGAAIASADEVWALITFVRAHYAGDPKQKFGAAAAHP